MATMANHDRETSLPICQNCSTSTTPLWRRDEMGSVLCNACGLFLKLHGRPRPISLKTDVIKSRNRVKTSMRPDMMKKKNNAAAVAAAAAAAAATMVGDPGSVVDLQSHSYATNSAAISRRGPHKAANGHHLDGTDSAMGGAGASGMYNTHASSNYPILDDGNYQGQHLQAFGAPGEGHAESNGDGGPQTSDQLAATNSSLKTRVAELEVINDFITRRLGHYEPVYVSGATAGQDGQDGAQSGDDAQLRSQVELLTQSERQLRSDLEESHRRENMMKRRLEELERELNETKEALGAYEGDRAKRPRLESTAGAADGVTVAATAAAAAAAAVAAAASAEVDAAKDAATAPASTTANPAEAAEAAVPDAEVASSALAALTAATAANGLDGASAQDVAAAAAAVAAVASDASKASAEETGAPASPKS